MTDTFIGGESFAAQAPQCAMYGGLFASMQRVPASRQSLFVLQAIAGEACKAKPMMANARILTTAPAVENAAMVAGAL